jgi:hypothetical protein
LYYTALGPAADPFVLKAVERRAEVGLHGVHGSALFARIRVRGAAAYRYGRAETGT